MSACSILESGVSPLISGSGVQTENQSAVLALGHQ